MGCLQHHVHKGRMRERGSVTEEMTARTGMALEVKGPRKEKILHCTAKYPNKNDWSQRTTRAAGSAVKQPQ